MRRMIAIVGVCAACQPIPDELTIDLAAVVDADGQGVATVAVDVAGERAVTVAGAHGLIVEIAVSAPDGVRSRVTVAGEDDAGEWRAGSGWFAPRPFESVDSAVIALDGDGAAAITAWARGSVLGPVRAGRSVAWRDDALLDDPAVVSLSRVMAAIADDGHGGQLFADWLRRFATTAHSQRPGPALLIAEIASVQGDDPTAWNLDALPFRPVAVHNRIDLAQRGDGCGQLRVTFASVHPIYTPLALIFLFRQVPADDDVAPDGAVHCLGTARRWSRLSGLDDEAMTVAAAAWLAAALRAETFLLAESLEQTEEPWEWRQWMPPADGPITGFDNPPLFQTVDIEAVNLPGSLRDDFLAFVEQNAAGLADRAVLIPERFAAPSLAQIAGEVRPRLDLTGVAPDVLARHPGLIDSIQIVGCPTCHRTPGDEFVMTYPDRTVSDLHFHELEARAELLDRMNRGETYDHQLYGPLHPEF